MLKHLVKDSAIYGIASVLQKLVPFLIIPVITTWLGADSLKIYDVSFLYAYLFSWLIILGQDSVASIFYFGHKERKDQIQVLNHGLIIQLCSLLVFCLLYFLFSNLVAGMLFENDQAIRGFWKKALLVVPGHIVLNYVMNILIWQKKKGMYFLLCLLQVTLSLGGAGLLIVKGNGSLDTLFYIMIGSTYACALTGLFLIRKELFTRTTMDTKLLKKMALMGWPFAVTSFFHQLLPSIDRFFLLQNHLNEEMPHYILAVKIGGLLSIGVGGFALAFTPYSMAKIHEQDGERDISTLFRFVSSVALMTVPILLLFRSVFINFFADPSYSEAGNLLPLLFFAWVFDLFSYFSLLGVYKSRKTHLVLWFFIGGTVLISVLNIILIPVYGIAGAAISLCVTKAALFFIPLFGLRKYFNIAIEPGGFIAFLAASVLCCYLIYRAEPYQYLLVLTAALAAALFYLNKLFQKHRNILAV